MAIVLAVAIGAVALVPFQTGKALGANIPSPSVPLDPGSLLHVKADISELPVPPTVPAGGVCPSNDASQPIYSNGCISRAWGAVGSPGFFWDPNYVLLGVTYAGAPSSIYDGPQVLLESTDGSTVANGQPWKCLTCGASYDPKQVLSRYFNYPPPHALPGDKQILVGNGILQCTASDGTLLEVTDPNCTAANTNIYPIYWGPSPLGGAGGAFGNGREWRLSPDGVHLAWDTLAFTSTGPTEAPFEGALSFNSAQQRYDLTSVYVLPQVLPWTVEPGNQLEFTPSRMIGELRNWSSDGQSILGIQAYESDSVDAWSTSLATGQAVPLTNHAEYTDPMFMSPNGKWLLAEEVAGSGRLDFISGMQGIPPITDQLSTVGYVSQIRNNGNRRFFLPWLVNIARSQSEQVNAGTDPNWNAAADPVWLADSTAVVWAENYACAANPSTLPTCPPTTEPGGRFSRVMIARFPTLPPSPVVAPAPIPDNLAASWATPYTYGVTPLPGPGLPIPTGTYTIVGKVRGSATVQITSSGTAFESIAATFYNYSDDGIHAINGTESVQNDPSPPALPLSVTWHDNLALSGQRTGTKMTSEPGGFTLDFRVLNSNNFQAQGTMTTTINGVSYFQPANGA